VVVSPISRHPRQCISTFARSLSQPIHTSGALTLRLARAPHTRLFLRRYFLRFGEGSTPPQRPILRYPRPDRKPGSSLCDLRPDDMSVILPA
jgi:hypothetical protein